MLAPIAKIETLLNNREIKKAEVLIAKQLRDVTQQQERAQLLIYRAKARLLSARPDDALDDLNTAKYLVNTLQDMPAYLEIIADCHFARFELASVGFADRNDTAQALKIYHQIEAEHPDYENAGWISYQLGRVLLSDNQVESAEKHFHDGLFKPSHIAALTAYCFERLAFIAYYDTRKLKNALTYIDKAIHTYPAQESRRWLVQVHILRSRILRDLRRYDQALSAAETAIDTIAKNQNDNKHIMAEALLTTAEVLAQFEGRERDVINYLQQFMQLSKKPLGVDVTWSRVHEILGDAYFKIGQFGLAANAYQDVLQFNPYHPWEVSLYFRMARAFYQHGDYHQTVLALRKMIAVSENDDVPVNDYHVYDMLGNALYAQALYDEALTAYRKALAIAPPNAEDIEKIKTYHDYAQEMIRA